MTLEAMHGKTLSQVGSDKMQEMTREKLKLVHDHKVGGPIIALRVDYSDDMLPLAFERQSKEKAQHGFAWRLLGNFAKSEENFKHIFQNELENLPKMSCVP